MVVLQNCKRDFLGEIADVSQLLIMIEGANLGIAVENNSLIEIVIHKMQGRLDIKLPLKNPGNQTLVLHDIFFAKLLFANLVERSAFRAGVACLMELGAKEQRDQREHLGAFLIDFPLAKDGINETYSGISREATKLEFDADLLYQPYDLPTQIQGLRIWIVNPVLLLLLNH